MGFHPSELVYQADGSVYHLALHPEQIADRIFLVGDPGRVDTVSRHFDRIDTKVAKREFVTHTGELQGQRLTVMSTGIGTDNIDIVLQELDILVNIHPVTRQPREQTRSLECLRLGTSGGYQADIQPGDLVLTSHALGFDNLLHFYDARHCQHQGLLRDFMAFADKHFRLPVQPYAVAGDTRLFQQWAPLAQHTGITLTLPGFYGPQGRRLRAPLFDEAIWRHLPDFRWEDRRITNFEMESSGIFGMAALLGHRAGSLNLILANRLKGQFHPAPHQAIEAMVEQVLSHLPANPAT